MDWINLMCGSGKWRADVKRIMNPQVPEMSLFHD